MQACIPSDQINVHESVRENFVGCLRVNLYLWYGEGGVAKEATLSRVISANPHPAPSRPDRQRQGARVLYGGLVGIDEYFVSPTLLCNLPDDARIIYEEVFGLLLSILPFRTLRRSDRSHQCIAKAGGAEYLEP